MTCTRLFDDWPLVALVSVLGVDRFMRSEPTHVFKRSVARALLHLSPNRFSNIACCLSPFFGMSLFFGTVISG